MLPGRNQSASMISVFGVVVVVVVAFVVVEKKTCR